MLAVVLIHYVVTASKIDVKHVLTSVDRGFLSAAFVCFGLGFFLAAYRWYLLLGHIEVNLSLSIVLRLALIGQFFNLFVPGGVGGDLIKMYYLKKESKERFPEAVLTVLLDRIIGLVGLLLVALLAIALSPELFKEPSPKMQAILLVVLLAGIGALAVAILFLAWPLLAKFGHLAARFTSKLPEKLARILERIAQSFTLLRSSPLVVAMLLGLAMLGHLSATFATVAIGYGVGGVEKLTFSCYLLVTQLANLVAAVPLTPGGLGGRDLAMSFLLGLCGAEPSAQGAIPLVTTTLLILWSIAGGLALLWEKRALPDEPEPGDPAER